MNEAEARAFLRRAVELGLLALVQPADDELEATYRMPDRAGVEAALAELGRGEPDRGGARARGRRALRRRRAR